MAVIIVYIHPSLLPLRDKFWPQSFLNCAPIMASHNNTRGHKPDDVTVSKHNNKIRALRCHQEQKSKTKVGLPNETPFPKKTSSDERCTRRRNSSIEQAAEGREEAYYEKRKRSLLPSNIHRRIQSFGDIAAQRKTLHESFKTLHLHSAACRLEKSIHRNSSTAAMISTTFQRMLNA